MSTNTPAAAQLHAESYRTTLWPLKTYIFSAAVPEWPLALIYGLHLISCRSSVTLLNNYDDFTIIQKGKCIYILTSDKKITYSPNHETFIKHLIQGWSFFLIQYVPNVTETWTHLFALLLKAATVLLNLTTFSLGQLSFDHLVCNMSWCDPFILQ